jgi:hypothetical protein
MKSPGAILQIVPRAPGNREGVGDYAWTLATGLRTRGYETTFVAAHSAGGSEILAPLARISDKEWRCHRASAIVLHYVNYGYHARGVPWSLPKKIERIHELTGARLITIFHELYASGSWRQSAFWLRPLQKHIVRMLAQRSVVSFVSSAALAQQLREVAPAARVIVRPVVSNFGEPVLSSGQITGRDSRRWVICGGTQLIRRSLRSFLRHFTGPAELFVVGGTEQSDIRRLLEAAEKISTHYLPNVEVSIASEVLGSCAFGWIDYFERSDVPTAAILKSTAFAAYCAHGVVPVLPAPGSTIALGDDALPGPFTLSTLPSETERSQIAQSVYGWYGRNASSVHLAESIAEVLAE